MSLLELLKELKSRGASVNVTDDGQLNVGPPSVLDDGIRGAIREHKAAIVARLSVLRVGDPGFDEIVQQAIGMPLDRFEREGPMLEVAVPWLADTLHFVPDQAHAEALVRRGVSRGEIWTSKELRDLLSIDGLTPEHVRAVALAKVTFAGDVVAVTPATRGTQR